jgi:hypothetical protein
MLDPFEIRVYTYLCKCILVYDECVRFFNHTNVSTPLAVPWPLEFDPCPRFDLIKCERRGGWLNRIHEHGDLTKDQHKVESSNGTHGLLGDSFDVSHGLEDLVDRRYNPRGL